MYLVKSNVFNLKNSIKNFLKKNHDHNHDHNKVYMTLYNNDNVVLPVVGDYCSCLGIDLNTIHLCLKQTNKNFKLNNGAVLELEDVEHREKLTWQAFSHLLFRLSSADF